MSPHYDLIVIGAGMAGVTAANKAAAKGWRVAIVDELPYGGTCALRGCDPKKILRRAAEVIDAARLLRGKGIDDTGLRVNWADLMRHKHGFTDPVPQNMEQGLATHGVDTLHGTARFTGPRNVTIDGATFEAGHFLIATGARPRPLDIPGHEHLIDSTQFLDLPELPQRILFVGGGFISFEFAHIAARAGALPTIIDRGHRPLKGFDPDLVEQLITRGETAGIQFRRATTLRTVEKTANGYRATLEQDGVSQALDLDLVVHGAGRLPALSGLDLDAAGVAWDETGVHVAPHLQSTTNPAVWSAGDSACTAGAPLTPVAVFESKVATSNMLGGTSIVPDYAGVPSAVFTIPELTRVGMLEHEAKNAGIDIDVRYTDTSGWYSNYRVGETTAATKILVDRATDRIVGAHLLGPEYGELVNTLGLAIKLGITTRQLKSTTAAYPTAGSDLGSIL